MILIGTILGVIAAMVVLTYAGLRLAHALPAQRRARAIAAASAGFVASPVFGQRVVLPLEQYLTSNLAIASNVDPFADFVRRSTQYELPLPAVFFPSRAKPAPVIVRWRTVLKALEQRDVRIYGLPQELRRGETWLREYVAARMRETDGVLSTATAQSEAVDRAVSAIDRDLGVSAQELNGILAVAECAQRLRQPAAGR